MAALVLSTLVIFGYNWWMEKFVTVPKARQASETVNPPAPAASRSAGEPRAESAQPPVSPAPAEPSVMKPVARGTVVVLENEDVVARLSSTGGRITSWQLKKFRATGTTIFEEMVPPRALVTVQGPLTVRLDGSEEAATAPASVSQSGKRVVTFTQRLSGRRTLVKRLAIPEKGCMADLEIELSGPAPATIDLVWKPGTGLSPEEEAALGRPETYQNVESANMLTTKDLVRQNADKKPVMKEGSAPFWAGVRNKYFLSAFIPPPVAECVGVEAIDAFAGTESPKVVEAGLRFRPKAGSVRTIARMKVYIGPQIYGDFKRFGARLDRSMDFGIFGIFAVWLLYALNLFAGFVHNYGIAIILLTIVVRALLWWPSQSSLKQMQKMKDAQPQINFINEKFKSEPQRKQEELMRLFKEKKINPLGGCLPFAFQLPVFFALFAVLGNAIELRGAPFMWWITDLSAKDPYYVTPILVGVTMYIQQLSAPTTGDATQAKMMRWMSLVFVLFFVNAPSGLNLYWLVQNLIQMGQQVYTTKLMKPNEARRT